MSATNDQIDITVQEPPAKKRRMRKPRSYIVGLRTPNHASSTTVEKSTPLAAASSVVRGSITHVPLQQDVLVSVNSHSKKHEYVIHRDYTNPKYRRFSIVKSTPTPKEVSTEPTPPDSETKAP